MVLSFAKYEGAGNDFVVIDARTFDFEPTVEFVSGLCDRHFGIGADGLMLLGLGQGKAEFDMRYYNADGREATMCGNGGRCIALFAHHLGIGGRKKLFSGPDGLHCAKIVEADDLRGVVELQMTDVSDIVQGYDYLLLDTGSPHYVRFVDSVEDVDVVSEGRAIRGDKSYGEAGVNVNFVEMTGEGAFRLRTYERGVEDETLACGTGATAAAIAAHVARQPDVRSFDISARGGRLSVSFADSGRGSFTDIWLKGPAQRVFSGKFETDNF
ncbi:MAG: diaminopimelate epimerase [Rikenellaceae bacterium]|jgi:diaminopimelate epimerase|nr:diaminopimelate epimerase [Rikenellaceae bacterium]